MKFSRKYSEHADIYANRKFTRIEDDFRPQTPEDAQDDTYKFKRTIELSKSYELYIETEKAYMTFKANGNRWWDPMETLAQKCRKDEPLSLTDLKNWITYNFLVFPEPDQEKIKALSQRQIWFGRWMQLVIPPLWFGSFAIFKYQLRLRMVSNFVASCGVVYAFNQLGLHSSNQAMRVYYQQLYDEYRHEVLSPQHRGKKLFAGKKSYQVDNLEFTSSNFDDLKQLIHN